MKFVILRVSQVVKHTYVHKCKADRFDRTLTLHRTINRCDLSNSVLLEISDWARCPLIDYPFWY
jgi:dsDNA-binding SOS-regulon protein